MCRIVEPAQMPDPFRADQVTKISRIVVLRPDAPWATIKQKSRSIPSAGAREIGRALLDRRLRAKKNRDRINDAEKTFGQAGECRTNPEAGEPDPSIAPALITARPQKMAPAINALNSGSGITMRASKKTPQKLR